MKTRPTTAAERALFLETLASGHPPLADKPKTPGAKPKPPVLAGKKPSGAGTGFSGLDGATQGRLTRGRIEPDARLDLHGLTEARAHALLLTFLVQASLRGHRLLLVVTGKGRAPAPDAPFSMPDDTRGKLRRLVPRWLAEPGAAPLVAGLHSAHRSHGGDGAFYVYLRKPR